MDYDKLIRIIESEVRTCIEETYESVNEIKKLASDTIKEVANFNYEHYNDIGKFDYLYGIKLSRIDSKNYNVLSDFINDMNIHISFMPMGDDIPRGTYVTYYLDKEKGEKFNPRHERSIEIRYDYDELKKDVDELLNYKNNNITSNDLYFKLFYKLYSALVHELQHAYDEYRSKHKMYQSKENIEYVKKYGKEGIKKEQLDDLNKMKEYLNLPHEIWARFSQAMINVNFYTFDFLDNDTIEYRMYSIHDVVKDFKRKFHEFKSLSDEMKKKLINKVVQFWHFEKDKIEKLNKEENTRE
ncbi:MAG: hypothetical protein ACOC3V_00230 [bacterium]